MYGRIVLINPTNADTQVQLKLGPTVGEAQLARNATLAVEVERKHVPGQDPRQTPAPIETRLFAPDGGVVWQDAAGDENDRETVALDGHRGRSRGCRRRSLAAGVDRSRADRSIERTALRRTARRKHAGFQRSRRIRSCLELFQGSGRKEVKSLVARSSIHVGLFEPFIDALRDSEQKANWKTHIETLRAAMALSPESAGKV